MNFPAQVLHVIPSVASCRGGPSEVIFPMLRELRARGWEVHLVTTNDDGPLSLDVDTNRFIEWQGVRVQFFPRLNFPNRTIRDFGYSAPFASWIKRHARDYALIHLHGLFSFVCSVAMAAARRERIPYVVRPLGVLGRWPLRQSAWRKKIYLSLFDQWNLKDAAAFHFTSPQEYEEASAFVPKEKAWLIPHGISLLARLPQAREKLRHGLRLPLASKIALFLGRLHPKKGIDLLLSALARRPNLPVTLLLAGDGESTFVRDLNLQILRLGLSEKVKLLGHVAGQTKELLLQGADFFVLPSRHENFGYAVLEALASGLPVVISNQVPFAAEVQKFNLGRVADLDVAALANALEEILTAPMPTDSASLRAFVKARYSWNRNAKTLIQVYASIAAPPQKNVLGGRDGVSFNHGFKDEHDHHVRPGPRRATG